MPADRQSHILDTLRSVGVVEVDALAREMDVTTQTVRRDLSELVARGLAVRTHGGARRAVSTSSADYEDRRITNVSAKRAIAARTAALVPDGASVMLNIGTTTEQVADALSLHKNLTIISNNINIIHKFRGPATRDVFIVGGAVRASDGAIIGEQAVEQIRQYKADFAIIGASGMDADGSVLDFDMREVAVARAILANARTKILVADHSKLAVNAPVRICDLSELDYVVTDKTPPESFLTATNAAGTHVIHPDQ